MKNKKNLENIVYFIGLILLLVNFVLKITILDIITSTMIIVAILITINTNKKVNRNNKGLYIMLALFIVTLILSLTTLAIEMK